MSARRSRRQVLEIEQILSDPRLLDEWTGRVVKGWERVGIGYSRSLKASKAS
ncbi:MAG: hypothetical protein JRN09_09055 [Nitrososphaerota archaeon]|nr:hypothetical protein [Nitrososphaerota archaeon]